jgi:hypothetical protein
MAGCCARCGDVLACPECDAPKELKRFSDCGCVICICEDDEKCHGCGAKLCGAHDPKSAISSIDYWQRKGHIMYRTRITWKDGRSEVRYLYQSEINIWESRVGNKYVESVKVLGQFASVIPLPII